jgi:hypothetical protein
MPAGVVTLLGASLWVSTLGDNPRLRGLDGGGAMHCYRLGGVAWSADSTRSRVNVLGGKFGSVFLFVFYSIFFVKCSPLHLVTIWLLRLYRKPISKGTLSVIFDPFCVGIETKSNTLAGECRHFSGYSLIITITPICQHWPISKTIFLAILRGLTRPRQLRLFAARLSRD